MENLFFPTFNSGRAKQVDMFKRNPTGGRGSDTNHPAYKKSIFATVAAEYSIGEVLLGSAYRGLLLTRSEADIDLNQIKSLPDSPNAFPEELGGPDLWHILLEQEDGGLASPVRGGQKSQHFPQLMPLVPPIAYYACVLGKVRSRWNPANLLLHVIGAGLGELEGKKLVQRLGKALDIEKDEDIFARFVFRAFKPNVQLPMQPPYAFLSLTSDQLRGFRGQTTNPALLRSPAERFCLDLEAVLDIKKRLTRRQWTVLLEALLRIGLATHVLWVCHINTIFWDLALSVLEGGAVPGEQEIEALLWQSHRSKKALLEFGYRADLPIKKLIEQYAYARFGINLLLYLLEDAGCSWSRDRIIGYSSVAGTPAPRGIRIFLEHLAANRSALDNESLTHGGISAAHWLRGTCLDILEEKRDLAKCDSGFTNNLLEFTRHVLGQVQTDNVEKISYDQAFLLANISGRKGRYQWITQPGPAMLISLVHACCYAQGSVPASIEDFRSHLADYGLRVPTGELAKGKVGADLASLGLVVDSPDAAGGRLLVDPF
jgi:hypothetical protein